MRRHDFGSPRIVRAGAACNQGFSTTVLGVWGTRNQPVAELLGGLPHDYKSSFLFVVDRDTLSRGDFQLLVVDLRESRGRTIRTIPAQVQCIENNLSIANLGFGAFAEAVDSDSVLRGFQS